VHKGEISVRPRLVLADDHPLVAGLLRDLLDQEFEVVATVSDGVELLAAARSLAPDAIVTDISMPGLDGIAAAAELLRDDPRRPVVLVTVDQDPGVARHAAAIGVLGFVTKVAAARTLLPAVRAALAGERYGLPETGPAPLVEATQQRVRIGAAGRQTPSSTPPLPPGGCPIASKA
jgi:DNA-binding NarL/FixJ family response regulator